MKKIKNSSIPVAILFVITALLTTSCGDKPQPQEELVQHTITLDFTAAFPHHTEVAASVSLHEWDPETETFIDTVINCTIDENNPTYSITSNSISTLYDCYVSYINLFNESVNVHAPFGSSAGNDKTYEIAFNSDKVYYWNDNAQYMVLR